MVKYCLDTFDGAKPPLLNRGKKRRSVSTLSPSAVLGALSLSKGIPRVLVRQAHHPSNHPEQSRRTDRGVEWVDFEKPLVDLERERTAESIFEYKTVPFG